MGIPKHPIPRNRNCIAFGPVFPVATMPPPRLILRHLAPSRRPTTSVCSASPILPIHQQTRQESTTRRHKKLLHIPPTPSYTPTPSRSPVPEILYNPPSAAPSVYHTPLKFLPAHDKRRALFAQHQKEVVQKQLQERVSPIAVTGTPLSTASVLAPKSALRAIAQANTTYLSKPTPSSSSSTTSEIGLPPSIDPPHQPKYHLTAEQLEEMRALRSQDPDTWTTARLAKKFDCSMFFVRMVAKNGEKAARVKAEHEAVRERWGPRRRMAREDRKRRIALWGRDA